MCGPCSEESGRWLDTSPSTLLPRLGFAHGSGAAYDVSAPGLAGRRRSRHEEWAATVRFQRALIREGCAAGRHAAPRVDTSQSSL
ncbi:Pas10 [Actinoplanes phage phiAsp2]|uniref:Pas10 n=1 Tax=Actinoplanes phage phiAsp2 TaxID=279303 RepID=Q6J821_9CAUD|nr:Pas10 [Actinoplanes phage phiAsp2]AAT36758.1 Pas10 [Actinoplanes phage phiAsp2]